MSVPFVAFTLLYLFLAVIVGFLMRRQFVDRTEPTPQRQPSEAMLTAIVVVSLWLSLILYALMGARILAAACGICWRGDLAPTGNARPSRPPSAHLGSQPCLADPCGGAPVHRVPSRICRDHDRPEHSYHRHALRIVLRGSAYIFRKYDSKADAVQRRWGAVFGMASVLTPFFQGLILGALATGEIRVVAGQVTTGFLAGWTTLFALACGAFALGLFAFLAATYLTVDVRAEPTCRMIFDDERWGRRCRWRRSPPWFSSPPDPARRRCIGD